MTKCTRNIGQVLVVLAIVGAIGFAAVACEFEAPGPGGEDTKDNPLSGTILIESEGPAFAYTKLTAKYDGGLENVTFQWNRNGSAIGTTATGNAYTTTAHGNYTVTVSAPGYTPKTSETVIVYPAPYPKGISFLEVSGGWSVEGDGTTPPVESLIIPDEYQGRPVVSIEEEAFSKMQLTEITIGNNVAFIGKSAFQDNKLINVAIPDSVTYIGESALAGNDISNVTIGNGVKHLEAAFVDDVSTSITLRRAGVLISDNTMGKCGAAFKKFYDRNGKKSGRYNYNVWPIEGWEFSE